MAFVILTARSGLRIRLMLRHIENWEATEDGSGGSTVYWSRQSIQVTEPPDVVDRLIRDAKSQKPHAPPHQPPESPGPGGSGPVL